jgi:phage-related minor tail protein
MASIFSLFGEIFIDNEKANKGLEETAQKGEITGEKLKAGLGKAVEVAAKVGTAVVGMASAVGGAAIKMATDTADYAGAIDDLSERTGVGREEIQRWKFALEQSGGNVNSLQTAVKKMSTVIESESKSAADAFETLGLSQEKLKEASPEIAFDEVVYALARMDEGTERNALGTQLLGKAYLELAPTLNLGVKGIEDLKGEADSLGMVMSSDAIMAADNFGDSMDKLKGAAEGLMNQLGSVAIEALQPLIDMIIAYLPTIQGIMKDLLPIVADLFQSVLPPLMELAKELFPVILDLINALLPIITQLIKNLLPPITDLLLMLLPPVVEIVQKLLPPLLQLIEPLFPLLDPILKLLQPILDLLMMILDPLMDMINAILPPLINIITKVIEVAIVPLQAAFTVIANILGGTVKAAFEWISNYINTIKKVFMDVIDFFKNVFTGNWKGAWESIKKIFSDIWEGIKTAFKIPINWVIDGINAFIRGINKIEIPDWVPGVGGKGFHLDEIKRLRVGIDYVPYDDMPALLHKGERVLTKWEAQTYQEQQAGGAGAGQNVFQFGGLHIENFNNNGPANLEELLEFVMNYIMEKINSKKEVWA